MKKTNFVSGVLLGISLLSALPAAADTVRVSGGSLQVSPSSYLKNMTLSVSGPNGFYAQEFSKTAVPRVSLLQDGQLADGSYTWSMTGSTNEPLPDQVQSFNDGRGDIARPQRYKAASLGGSFRISAGTLVQPDLTLEEE